MRLTQFLLTFFVWSTLSSKLLAAETPTPQSQGVSRTWIQESGEELVKKLKQGQLVLFFRHGATNWDEEDLSPQVTYELRSTQRNLSALGKEQAEQIAQIWRTLQLPFGRLVASPYFRARDFARLLVNADPEISFAVLGDTAESLEGHRQLLTALPQSKGNTVIVGHQFALVKMGIFPMNELEEGNCAIFDPQSGNPLKPIAHLRPSDWAKLARGETFP